MVATPREHFDRYEHNCFNSCAPVGCAVSWSPPGVKIENPEAGPSSSALDSFPPLESSMSLGFLNSLDMDKLVQDMQLNENGEAESATRNKK
eukprot:1194373-Prorocentrum_minimum.AAC.8